MNHEPGSKLFSACGIDKSFPAVQALSGVDFDLCEGEVHALVGENGAGKSTLAGIIAGVSTPDAGEMELASRPHKPRTKAHAEALGVRMVMQELNLISNLSIAENIFIEKMPSKFGFVSYRRLNKAAAQIMDKVGLGDIDPSLPVKKLGVGRQQMVEIAAGLSRSCRILILDEPTASLTDTETDLLFQQIEKLKSRGVGIIYISHRIEEIMQIADRVTVLRDGKRVATERTSDLTAETIIRLMVGRDLEHAEHGRGGAAGQVALRAVGLNLGDKVRDVSFEVRRGEILGVAGLMGAGRTEIMRLVFGADRPESGRIYLGDSAEPTQINSPRDAVRNRIAMITEDRKEQGLLLSLPVRANISLTQLPALSRFGWMDTAKERATANRYIDALSVRCSSEEQKVRELSGGNQQKIVIAKWLFSEPDIIIFDEPTRGIDVAAKFEIYRMLGNLAGKDKAIIFVSSDLKELMAVCDRMMVVSDGVVADTFDRDNWTRENIMAAALSEYVGK